MIYLTFASSGDTSSTLATPCHLPPPPPCGWHPQRLRWPGPEVIPEDLIENVLLQKIRPGHPLPDEAQCLLSWGSLKPKRQSRESYSRDVKIRVGSCYTQNCFIWESFDCHICFEVSKLSWKKAFQQNWPSRPGRGHLHEIPLCFNCDRIPIGPANYFFYFPPFLPTLPIFCRPLVILGGNQFIFWHSSIWNITIRQL